MNREEFIISAAIVLFLTFLLGWLSRWLLQRLNMVSEKDLNDLNKISAALFEVEEKNEKARNSTIAALIINSSLFIYSLLFLSTSLYGANLNSIRLLVSRPSSVSLSAIGCNSPYPLAT